MSKQMGSPERKEGRDFTRRGTEPEKKEMPLEDFLNYQSGKKSKQTK